MRSVARLRCFAAWPGFEAKPVAFPQLKGDKENVIWGAS
jgi:hypothetical protein